MSSVLKNVLAFTALVVGVPTPIAHGLNMNGLAKVPRLVIPSAEGFTITADATSVIVTRTSTGVAAVNVYVELWHTYEDAEPLPNGISPSLLPFVANGGNGSGGGIGPGTANTLAKFITPTTIGDSGIADDGSIVSIVGRQVGIGSAADPTGAGGSLSWIENFGSATRANQLYVYAHDAGRTNSDSTSIYVNNSATYNTTSGAIQAVGVRIIHDPSRTSGGNLLNNVGLLIDTNAGDTNTAIWVTHGTVRFDEQMLTAAITMTGNLVQGSGLVTLAGTAGSSLTFTGAGGNISVSGSVTAVGDINSTGGNIKMAGNTLWFTDNSDTNLFIYADSAGTSGNQSIDIMAGGTGNVRVNANTDGIAHTGTGGFEVWAGSGSSTKWLDVDSGGFKTANISHGFYGHAAVALQTGVAVTVGAIHAALVALGLITA